VGLSEVLILAMAVAGFAAGYLAAVLRHGDANVGTPSASHNTPSAPCPNCNGRGVGSRNSDGLPNTCLVCHGTGTAHVG
jgi:DnaJ-class molecular chaperone